MNQIYPLSTGLQFTLWSSLGVKLETGRCALGALVTDLQQLAGIWSQDQANMIQSDTY